MIFRGMNKLYMCIYTILCCSQVYSKQTEEQMVINALNNINWRIIANNKVVSADKNSWIVKQKYYKSIIKVIAKAVADCITDQNEFENKNDDDVITFSVTPERMKYLRCHWNAVLVYNLVQALKVDYKRKTERGIDDILNDISVKVSQFYQKHYEINKIQTQINAAIKDIRAYDEALSLLSEIRKFITVGEATREKTFAWLYAEEIRVTPYAKWSGYCLSSKNFDSDEREAFRKDEGICWHNCYTSDYAGDFLPIMGKIDNKLYFANTYRFWVKFNKHFAMEIDLSDITVQQPLDPSEMTYDELSAIKHKLVPSGNDEQLIRKKIEQDCISLFDDLDMHYIFPR